MLFNSIDFIIFFVVVLTCISIIKQRKFHHVFLLLASYFFFYFSSNYLIVLLIASTLLDFYVGKAIWKSTNESRRKILLYTSVIGNLGLLGFFKYSDFAILQFNIFGNYINLGSNIPFLDLALPVGISFYTFQTLSYTIDIYRKQLEPSKSLSEFALFVSFFPQLVAGPIVRARDFLPQLREKIAESSTGIKLKQIVIQEKNLKIGITIMMIGFLKKMFFADNIAPFVDGIFSNPIGHESLTIMLATIAFGLQVYGDFSGYSDIAIGAALILGFKLPMNFNKPYFATSTSEFWRRWHITLSSWVKDYLFFPIIFRKLNSDMTYIFGMMVTFFLLGLWHGAGWNFIFFGLIHGVYVTLDFIIRKKSPSFANNSFFKNKIGRIISILGTQYLIFFAFIAFRVKDTNDMLYSMYKFVVFDFSFNDTISIIKSFEIPIGLMILFIALLILTYKKQNMVKGISNLKTRYWFFFLVSCMILIVLFYGGTPEEFIYFKF
jgi:alginate O-acetyltransferase complex protein AlgI